MKTMCRVVFVTLLMTRLTVGQEEWLTPPLDVMLDGMPGIPASLAKFASNFRTGFSDAFLGWDPVKPEPLFVRRTYTDWQFLKGDTPGGKHQWLGYVPGWMRETYYHRNGKYFVVEVSDPSELSQLYRQELTTERKTLLTDGKSRNRWACWSNSGEWLMYSSNRRNGKDMDLYMVNPLDPKTDRQVAQVEGESWGAYDWSPDDRKVILTEFKSVNESYLWVLDLETKSKKLITPAKRGELIYNGYLAQFSADGKGVFHLTDRDSEFLRLAYLEVATGRYTYLTSHIESDIEEFVLSPDRTLLAFTVNEDGLSRLHVLDTTNRRERRVPDLPSGVISKLSWHNDGNLLGFSLSSAVRPGDVYAIDLKQDKLVQWTKSSTGSADAQGLREPELITWKSFDGRRISGFLYRPAGRPSRCPVIIDIHGGPRSQSRPAFDVQDRALMDEFKISFLYPNIRGSTGYGKTFVKLDDGVLPANCTKDIGALLEWIGKQPDLASDRVMVRGGSYGGYVALSVAVKHADRIRGTIAFSAPSNLVSFLQNANKSIQDRNRMEFGDERDTKMRHFLDSIAPSNQTQRLRGPVLIAHGGRDARVPVSEAGQIVEAARRHGVPVWYLLAKGDGHGLTSKSRDFLFYAQVMFIRHYLMDRSGGSAAALPKAAAIVHCQPDSNG